MYREIEIYLTKWKTQIDRMPLLIRGARQVGKSYIVETWGKKAFNHIVSINFEIQRDFVNCFSTLEPTEILNKIFLLSGEKIEKGVTLLFLDEIQDCPNAIRALRYFKEKMPELHVIGAGSLLEFTLNDADFRMPVGRVQSLYLKPLSFKEFLMASEYSQLLELLQQTHINQPIEKLFHDRLLKLIREYMALGGMPSVLKNFFHINDYARASEIQTALLNTYRQDFGKYATQTDSKYLQRLYDRAPGLVGQDFKYVKVDPDMRSRDIKRALEMLYNAGILYPVYSTAASGLPLISLVNEKKFKILFLDIGLIVRANKLEPDLLTTEDVLLINRGVLAEQLVGQELLAYSPINDEARLYFWNREEQSSTAEIDFLISIGQDIIPIEVKAGKTGRLKSLKIFMNEKKSKLGVKISQEPLHLDGNVLSVPLYMIFELNRLVTETLKNLR